jgi:hypothetical protein
MSLVVFFLCLFLSFVLLSKKGAVPFLVFTLSYIYCLPVYIAYDYSPAVLSLFPIPLRLTEIAASFFPVIVLIVSLFFILYSKNFFFPRLFPRLFSVALSPPHSFVRLYSYQLILLLLVISFVLSHWNDIAWGQGNSTFGGLYISFLYRSYLYVFLYCSVLSFAYFSSNLVSNITKSVGITIQLASIVFIIAVTIKSSARSDLFYIVIAFSSGLIRPSWRPSIKDSAISLVAASCMAIALIEMNLWRANTTIFQEIDANGISYLLLSQDYLSPSMMIPYSLSINDSSSGLFSFLGKSLSFSFPGSGSNTLTAYLTEEMGFKYDRGVGFGYHFFAEALLFGGRFGSVIWLFLSWLLLFKPIVSGCQTIDKTYIRPIYVATFVYLFPQVLRSQLSAFPRLLLLSCSLWMLILFLDRILFSPSRL